ncbi:MAG: LysM peptidoglycan-binding domain-containing protein [Bacteroidota bacterium]
MKLSQTIAFSFLFLFFFSVSRASVPMLRDSIGVERKGGKILILHKVEPGQTLSSIARQYRVSLGEMKAENPGSEAGLQPGQIVKVPYVMAKTSATVASKPAGVQSSGTHTVAEGESLFGIAKLYHISVADLQKWNGLGNNSIKVGDELAVSAKAAQTKVATKPAEVVKEKPVATTPNNTATDITPVAGQKKHTVAPGQTLNAISKMYKVSLIDLRKWNNLSMDTLNVGQELVVQGKATTATTYTTEEPAAMEEPVSPKAKEKEAELEKAPLPVEKPEVIVAKTEKEKKEESKIAEMGSIAPTSNVVPLPGGYTKTQQIGLAELIEGTQANEKYLALHRTAPVGTIIQVKNLMNDLSVFVKVIGKLPDTGANDKIVIKISSKAFERLAAVDKKFRVEVSYIP